MSAVAAAVVGGVVGIGGALIQANAAQGAAQTQANALNNSLNMQQGMFNTIQANEQPYIQGGAGAMSELKYLLGEGTPGVNGEPTSSAAGGFGSLNAPFTVDQFHKMSPAYQFDLQQGGQGVLNGDTSGQGALSGAAMKDLISFNSNYANNSFNNAFQQYQTQQNNVFNRLNTLATLGSNAGSNNATNASGFASSMGNTASNIGTANAAGQVGVANAITGGLGNLSNSYMMSQAMPWLTANNSSSPYYAYSGGYVNDALQLPAGYGMPVGG